MTDFGWHYPPGVTGNEPQIRGVDPEEACAQCGTPFDYDEPIKLCAEVYVCDATCEARWVVRHPADFPPRTVLDAALELEDEGVVVRVLRIRRLASVGGRVIRREGPAGMPAAYVLADDDPETERAVLARDIRAVKVVDDGS